MIVADYLTISSASKVIDGLERDLESILCVGRRFITPNTRYACSTSKLCNLFGLLACEDFIIHNWDVSEFGESYDLIYSELVSQQFVASEDRYIS